MNRPGVSEECFVRHLRRIFKLVPLLAERVLFFVLGSAADCYPESPGAIHQVDLAVAFERAGM